MPFDDTGFVYDRRPDKPGAEPQAFMSLTDMALVTGACLLAWGLAFAVLGIGLGVLTLLGAV